MNNRAPYTPIAVDVKTTPKCKLCNDTGEQRYWEARWRDEKAENDRLRAALSLFVACAYPVAKSINPRGYAWRSEVNLDCALDEAETALGRTGTFRLSDQQGASRNVDP